MRHLRVHGARCGPGAQATQPRAQAPVHLVHGRQEQHALVQVAVDLQHNVPHVPPHGAHACQWSLSRLDAWAREGRGGERAPMGFAPVQTAGQT